MRSEGGMGGVDLGRFVMALGVVLIHLEAMFYTDGYYGAFLDWFIRLAVPFFFMASGYLVLRRMETGAVCVKEYLGAKALRFLKLYLVWSAICLPLGIYMFATSAHPDGVLIDLRRMLTAWLFIGQLPNAWMLWFLYSLVFVYGAMSVCVGRRGRMTWLVVVFCVCYAMRYAAPLMADGGMMRFAELVVCERMFGGGLYVLCGMLAYKLRRVALAAPVWLGMTVVSVILYGMGWRIFEVFGAMGVFGATACMKLPKWGRYRVLGGMSLWIYLIHMYVLTAIYATGEMREQPWLLLVVAEAMTVVFSAGLEWGSQHVSWLRPLRRLVR